MIYLRLYLEFLKIGMFAVGGGFTALPFIRQLAEKYGWITERQILDMIAISESTPGSMSVNSATFVGNKTVGILGGLVATAGVVTPSIIIILLIAHYFLKFCEAPTIRSMFSGIRPAVTGLIAAVGFGVARIVLLSIDKLKVTSEIFSVLNVRATIIFGVVLFLMIKYKKHPIIYLLGLAIVGIIFKF
ncbi:MAG TPA: chromate transporter [Clostridia bacterium]|nr:chromate transporter [Clostridia bacterium]